MSEGSILLKKDPKVDKLEIRHNAILLLITLFGIVHIIISLPPRANENDFAHYYISSQILLSGQNPYKIDLAERYANYGFVFDERIYQQCR
jgi:hypothetical protein